MLAILGHLYTSAGNRLPGEIAYGLPFTKIPTGLAALDVIPAAGLLQLVSLLFPESHFGAAMWIYNQMYAKWMVECF